MLSPLFLDGDSAPLLSASCAKSDLLFSCMDAFSTIKRFGPLSSELAPESTYDQRFGQFTSSTQAFHDDQLLKDSSKCAQFNVSPMTSAFTPPLVDSVTHNELQG
uniref:MEIOC protein n=1 Tax=Syphacia muris TaxID=451379 RepID=A0A0N5AW17_9BILA